MILDFLFVFSVLGACTYGYIKGFAKILISFLAFLLSLVIVFTLFDWVGDSFLKTEYGGKFYNSVSTNVNSVLDTKDASKIEDAPYISSLVKLLFGNKGNIDFTKLTEKIAVKTTKTLFNIPMIIITFLLVKLAFFLLKRFAGTVTRLPFVGFVDSLSGALLGLIIGILIICGLFFLCMFLQFVPSLSFLKEQLDSSAIILLINDFIF